MLSNSLQGMLLRRRLYTLQPNARRFPLLPLQLRCKSEELRSMREQAQQQDREISRCERNVKIRDAKLLG